MLPLVGSAYRRNRLPRRDLSREMLDHWAQELIMGIDYQCLRTVATKVSAPVQVPPVASELETGPVNEKVSRSSLTRLIDDIT